MSKSIKCFASSSPINEFHIKESLFIFVKKYSCITCGLSEDFVKGLVDWRKIVG
jgi:hypothetical protein